MHRTRPYKPLIDRMSFTVDGADFDAPTWGDDECSAEGGCWREFEGDYSSLDVTLGTHAVDACLHAKNDKYERKFCAGEWTFLNVGPPVPLP